MNEKDVRLHNGVKGAALGIRVIPRARSNQIAEVLNDGTIKIRLQESGADLNESLQSFLATILGVSVDDIDIVAGKQGREKLVSILNITPNAAHAKIIARLT